MLIEKKFVAIIEGLTSFLISPVRMAFSSTF